MSSSANRNRATLVSQLLAVCSAAGSVGGIGGGSFVRDGAERDGQCVSCMCRRSERIKKSTLPSSYWTTISSSSMARPQLFAFTSLISAGGVPTTAAYGLIALLRLTLTPDDFKSSHYFLGKWRKPFYFSAVIFNALIFAVRDYI